MRIGHGYDVHRFGPGDSVVLGGVRIPHTQGVVAHSDGDVLLHALCDALLGAIGAGDIGKHFPDTDTRYRGIDSRELLRKCRALIGEAGYRVANADLTVIAERPRIGAYVDAMRGHIANDLGCGADQINIKATTSEGMGFVGREDGLCAHAVVLLACDTDQGQSI